MNVRKIIQKHLHTRGGTIATDVNAAIAANVGERGTVTKVSSTQTASAGRTQSESKRSERA